MYIINVVVFKKNKLFEWELREKKFLYFGDKYDNIIRLYMYE